MTLVLFVQGVISFLSLTAFIVQPIEILQGIQRLIPLIEILLEI